MRRCVWLLALALALTACVARADTPDELRAQAREPWQETISAYGREIVLDVTAQMPDAEQVNVYRVCTVNGEGDEGDDGRARIVALLKEQPGEGKGDRRQAEGRRECDQHVQAHARAEQGAGLLGP